MQIQPRVCERRASTPNLILYHETKYCITRLIHFNNPAKSSRRRHGPWSTRRFVHFGNEEVSLPEARCQQRALALDIRRQINVFVDGDRASLVTRLLPGAKVIVMMTIVGR